MSDDRHDGAAPTDPAARFRHLPEPVDPADTVAMVATDLPPDPDGGRDPGTEWMLKHA